MLRKKREYETFGNHLSSEVVDLVLKLRSEHKLGTWRIKWYMERFHDINTSESGVYRTLKRHNIERLDRKRLRDRQCTLSDTLKTPLTIMCKWM